jgi:hypothetical protein
VYQNLTCKKRNLAPGEEAYVVLIGFRFAPKLHGILTKAQAVLQLFLLAGLYQLGSVHAR